MIQDWKNGVPGNKIAVSALECRMTVMKSSSMTKKISSPRAVHTANLWSLAGHPAGKTEWSLERKMKAVKDAGFDAITTNLTPDHRRLAEKLGLRVVGFFSSADASEFEGLFQRQKDGGATSVNVQLGDHDTPTTEALRLARRLIKIGRDMGLSPSVEVHRDTCTETPEKTYALADRYRKATGELLQITWDFSHIAVVKHLPPPFHDRLLERPDLVQRAEQFHLRPFNGHHCQVPVTTNRGKDLTRELEDWLPFVEKTLEMWLASKANANREVFLIPEMGPVRGGYNLSSLPPSWPDAIRLREELDRIWKKVLRRAGSVNRRP